jgi:ABC-type bacteriocin/lantibiotic exporter with double-glycine peptidase domain
MIWGFVGWQAVIIVTVLIVAVTTVLVGFSMVLRSALVKRIETKANEQKVIIRRGE